MARNTAEDPDPGEEEELRSEQKQEANHGTRASSAGEESVSRRRLCSAPSLTPGWTGEMRTGKQPFFLATWRSLMTVSRAVPLEQWRQMPDRHGIKANRKQKTRNGAYRQLFDSCCVFFFSMKDALLFSEENERKRDSRETLCF